MAGLALAVHERVTYWARQLRPRLAERPVRLAETRSWADLEAWLRGCGTPCPLLVVDLSRRAPAALDDLAKASAFAPDALTLVLDPAGVPGAHSLARELGATHVISGPATPPDVASLLGRWLGHAQRRADALGWSGPADVSTEPEPWNWLSPLLPAQADA